MNKIWIIAYREFKVKIQKKSFKIMTLLGPLFFAAVMIVPIWIKTSSTSEGELIYVADEWGYFPENFSTANENLHFSHHNEHLENAKIKYLQGKYLALLYLPKEAPVHTEEIKLYSKKKLPLKIRHEIEKAVAHEIHQFRLAQVLKNLPTQELVTEKEITINNESITQHFDSSEVGEAAGGIGLFLAVLIYFFVIIYGAQVMRSVMEEKNSRIVEILISSVSPFQLMMGKITGVAMVSLLQFLVWISSSSIITLLLNRRFGKSMDLFKDENISQTLQHGTDLKQSLEVNEFINSFQGIDGPYLMTGFLIFFIGGYLLYSSILAAIGAVADNETDVQQFMIPVTLPLFISITLLTVVTDEPHGKIAVWLSIFPLTSPVIMMVRLPYGVPAIQFTCSIVVLITSFLFSTWCAAKIYRAGILMYGKKISYVEIIHWLTSKSRA